MINSEKNSRGIIAAVLYHTVIAIILMALGFVTPLPLPEEEGILVEFGNSPVGSNRSTVTKQRSHSVREEPTPTPTTPTQQPPATSTNEEKKELITQDFEESVAIDTGKKKEDEEKIEAARQAQLEKERKERAAELEREQREEEEKRKREEEERQKREEEERRKKAEEQKKIDDINSRIKNAFSSEQATDDGKTGSGHGVGHEPGNQGSPSGTQGANRYGTGGAGDGVSYSLEGRKATQLPKPEFAGNEGGVVVVEITVDKYGKVTKANPGVRGSTTLDANLLNAAKKAAESVRFNTDENAPAFQKGTIRYNFVLY